MMHAECKDIRLMAERKQGPVKPPTIDLTARDANAGAEKPARSSARKVAPEVEAVETGDDRCGPRSRRRK